MMAEWICYMLGIVTGIAISEIANVWTNHELYRIWDDYRRRN